MGSSNLTQEQEKAFRLDLERVRDEIKRVLEQMAANTALRKETAEIRRETAELKTKHRIAIETSGEMQKHLNKLLHSL